jgi:hypothetical protein
MSAKNQNRATFLRVYCVRLATERYRRNNDPCMHDGRRTNKRAEQEAPALATDRRFRRGEGRLGHGSQSWDRKGLCRILSKPRGLEGLRRLPQRQIRGNRL